MKGLMNVNLIHTKYFNLTYYNLLLPLSSGGPVELKKAVGFEFEIRQRENESDILVST